MRCEDMKKRRNVITLAGTVATCAIVLCVYAPSASSQVPAPRDFAEFLAARDLVVLGTVLGVEETYRQRLENCGVTGLGKPRVTEVTLHVAEVWLGTAEDTVLQVTILGHRAFSMGNLRPGVRALVWAHRSCDDGWRLWGNLAYVSPQGLVVGRDSDSRNVRLRDQATGEPLGLNALHSALVEPAAKHASKAFEGVAAVGLARLLRTIPRDSSAYAYELESLGWLLGSAETFPQYLDVSRVPDCYPMLFPGDSLLIPVPRGFSGTRLAITSCPRALKVQHRYLPGLGVPLGFIRYAISQQNGTLHVKPFIGRPEDE